MTLIHIERRGPIELWTLDRAERLNALPDLEDGEAFAAACEAVNADREVRFVVLTGAFFAAHAVANGWAAAEAPENARGQVGGLYTLSYYLGSSIGGTVGATVYGHAGWTWLIVLTAAWLAIAAIAVLKGTFPASHVVKAPFAASDAVKASLSPRR